MSPETLALLLQPAFAWSLLLGAFAAVWALAEQRLAARRPFPRNPAPQTPAPDVPRRVWIDLGTCAGVAFFLALALLRQDRRPLAGVGALLVGLGLEAARFAGLRTGALLALPGAAVLAASAGPAAQDPTLDGALLFAAPAGALVAASATLLGPGRTLLCLVLSVLGLFYSVPDTEEAVLLLGVTLPLLPLALLRDPPALRPLGAGAFAGTLAFVAATGAQQRPPAAIAALACLGLLLLAPLLAPLARHPRIAREWPGPRSRELAGGQLLLVFVAARLVPRPSPLVALLAELAWLGVCGALLLALSPRRAGSSAAAPESPSRGPAGPPTP